MRPLKPSVLKMPRDTLLFLLHRFCQSMLQGERGLKMSGGCLPSSEGAGAVWPAWKDSTWLATGL